VLAGKKDLPASTTQELLTLLRQNPGKYNFASSGVGTSLHVAGEMINIEGQVKMVHVPYRVGAQMVTDLVGNQIDLAVLPLVMALPNYRAGNIKVFGITEPERLREMSAALRAVLDTVASRRRVLALALTTGRSGPLSPWGRFVAARARADELIRTEIEARRRGSVAEGDDVLSLLLAARDEDGEPG
jgi:hypothetical protein